MCRSPQPSTVPPRSTRGTARPKNRTVAPMRPVRCGRKMLDVTSIEIKPVAGRIRAKGAELFVANSGTTMRFLTAVAALGEGTFRLDGTPRMRQRPIGDLLDALAALGVDSKSEKGNGCPPVVIRAKGLPGGQVM